MSTKALQPLNCPVYTADPATGTAGDFYYNSNTVKFRYYNGTTWNDWPGAAAGSTSFATLVKFGID